MKLNIKKGDWIKLKRHYGFKPIKAKVLEIYKDTIKVLAYKFDKTELMIIFHTDILMKI